MVGHLDVPGLTDKVPASLSPAAYQLLRTEFGFTGVTMTDDLGAMKAITDSYDLPTAVLTALRAGADIALWTSTEICRPFWPSCRPPRRTASSARRTWTSPPRASWPPRECAPDSGCRTG